VQEFSLEDESKVRLNKGTTYLSDIKVVPQMLMNAASTDMQRFDNEGGEQ